MQKRNRGVLLSFRLALNLDRTTTESDVIFVCGYSSVDSIDAVASSVENNFPSHITIGRVV